jgi:hypothetical protein
MRLFADERDEKIGEFREVSVNQPDGSISTILVTEKWLQIQKLEELLKTSPEEYVKVNFIGPQGRRLEILKIGDEIESEMVRDFIDNKSNELYGIYSFSDGEENIHLVTKPIWEEALQRMADLVPFINSEVKHIIDGS